MSRTSPLRGYHHAFSSIKARKFCMTCFKHPHNPQPPNHTGLHCLSTRTQQPLRTKKSNTEAAMSETNDNVLNFRYQWQEDIENLERYRHGEYHPVKLGDEFCDGRYRVVHKLGWGSYSTVWLARDQIANRHVALKIIVALASDSSNESRILRLLEQHRAAGPNPTGEHFVAQLLDEFTFEGPNGHHRCLVSEPAGCSISDSHEAGTRWLFPLQIARAIAAKIVLGVEFLHGVGVVHGGESSSQCASCFGACAERSVRPSHEKHLLPCT